MEEWEFIRLELYGFKRLALSDTKNITIMPDSKVHLILGTNGSGKSSIMELITPLPPDRRDFSPDGFKKLMFRHNNDYYNITSEGTKHSVRKNNRTIHDSIGIKAMLEVCKLEFNITPALHSFMLGKTSFVTMSQTHRKDFITSISNIDYDYVNKLYSNIKRKLKDSQAVQQHISNKLLAFKDYILKEDEINALVDKKNKLNEYVYSLYSGKRDVTTKRVSQFPNTKLLNKLRILANELKESNITVNELNDEYAISTKETNSHKNDMEKLELELLEFEGMGDLTGITNKKIELESELSDLLIGRIITKDNINTIFPTISGYQSNYVEYIDFIQELIDTIALYSGSYIKPELIRSTTELRDELKTVIRDSELETESINDVKNAYIQSTNKLHCPNCNTAFDDTTVFNSVTSMDVKLNNLSEIINTNKSKLTDVESTMIDIDNHIDIDNRLTNLLTRCRLDSHINLSNTDNTISSLSKLKRDIKTLSRIDDLNTKVGEVNKLLNMDSDRYNTMQLEYDEMVLVSRKLTERNKALSRLYSISNSVDREMKELMSDIKAFDTARKHDITKINNDTIDTMISALKEEIHSINIKVDKFHHAMSEEKNLSNDLDDIKNDIDICKILLAELSPSTGLIGDSIKSFLGIFINEVNSLISKVWSYPLEVMPFEDNDKGVTCKFPIFTNGEYNTSDISLSSESMREIIGLAFRLVSMKYMGMSNMPLFIDEFGNTMDEVHLVNAYDLLERYAESNDCQLIIIAHIKTCYNRFNNAGITIVSDLNMDTSE